MRNHDAAAGCITNAGTMGLSIKGLAVRCQWGRGKRKLTDARQRFPPDTRTSCWFCLASPELEDHLLVLLILLITNVLIARIFRALMLMILDISYIS